MLCVVVLCRVGMCCVVLCSVGLGCVLLCWFVRCVRWRACFVVMCAVERRGGAIARRELQDLSVTVELGLCRHCSRLPGKVDNQTD